MKEELTRETVEKYLNEARRNMWTNSKHAEELATTLLEEMEKPKVWDGAPEDALQAQIIWFTKNGGYIGMKTYTRKLPKTRARIMAEEIAAAQISNKSDLVDIIEQTINTHMKELKGEE